MFSIVVPAAAPGTEETMPRAVEAVPAVELQDQAVLLIDDDAEVLQAARDLIATWGYRVVAARSFAHACAQLKGPGARIGLIVADFRLGDALTGADAIRAVRERLDEPVPAVIITGDTSPERIREATVSGFRLLHKPLDPLQLQDIVREAMQAAASRRSSAAAR